MTHAEKETIICVGALVLRDDSLLLVRQAEGHPLAGQWTIPWGKLENGESPAAAALREVAEEGGVTAKIDGLVGAQELPQPWDGWIALIYACGCVHGEPEPDNHETDAAQFLTLEMLDELNEPFEPWSLWLVRRVLSEGLQIIEQDSSNPFSPAAGFV